MADIGTWFFGLLALVPGFGGPVQPVYSGYVEADYIYVAPVQPGVLAEIAVAEGEAVHKGAVLARLADAQQRAALAGAEARVVAAEASLKNLESGGRQEEVDVARASLARAEADLTLARQNQARSEKLFDQGLIPRAQVDQADAALAAAAAQVDQLKAQLAVAELPARSQQQIAAQASLDAAEADADRARADLADRVLLAPADGIVEKLYFDAGEMAGAGAPVLSLLPESPALLRFYVPEPERAGLHPGTPVAVSCDGCAEGLSATVTRLASDPQFTAPIIFSRQERGRLVYLVEARLGAGANLLPGQPVSVMVAP